MSTIDLASIQLTVGGSDQNETTASKSYPWPLIGPWIPICFPTNIPIFLKGFGMGTQLKGKPNPKKAEELSRIVENKVMLELEEATNSDEVHRALEPVYKFYPKAKKEVADILGDNDIPGIQALGFIGSFIAGVVVGLIILTAMVIAENNK
ncbi:MAG: hypothetical protein Crog4KO_05690 [Crocinitomicaceae bacterium]